jgi:aryl-alcohol dehydrogenase-like predicted oxidoreductase
MLGRIAIGTANFMTDYNGRMLDFTTCTRILYEAYRIGIRKIDTAHAYGAINAVVLANWTNKFSVITKYSNFDNLPNLARNSAAILAHSSPLTGDYDNLKKKLNNFKVGYSIYTVQELEYLTVKGIKYDYLEIPYSIYDRRFEPYLPSLKHKHVIARSIYGKGRIFNDARFNGTEKDAATMALSFVLRSPYIKTAVLGVDSVQQVAEIPDLIKGIRKYAGYDYSVFSLPEGIDYKAVVCQQ